ncbi:hypothetical protein [Halosimplex sp. TS25]|uniref:hypothetical protein n=1 Tax=Halosimplex rarum TaxID=3396619 RepID=UPI0039E752B1
MESWDDRGQSIQIGAVLVFAAVVILLSIYQAAVVPQQNERAEFDHSQQIQGELLDLRNAVVSTVGDSAQQSVSVTLGTTYPPRLLAVNPPPASGQLRTVGTADGDVSFGLANATALDDETDDFWDGTRRDYDTGGIVYRPNYNEYGQPPSTIYENSVLYDDFSVAGSTVTRSGQALVDGTTVSLVALNGSISESSSGTRSVDVRPVSASSRTVAVRNAGPDSNVTVRVPTRLSESRWEELLADEFVAAGGNVTDVRTNPLPAAPTYRMLVVDLVPGTYDLRMAKAGVGTRVTGTKAAYVTEIRGNGTYVPEGGTEQFVVEVRDRYNNPVSGVTVRAATDGTGTVTARAETGDNGRASLIYRAPANVDGAPVAGRVNASFAVTPGSGPGAFAGGRPENVSMDLTVRNTDGSGLGGGGGGGGGAGYALRWTAATTVPGTTSGGVGCASTSDACNVTMRAETERPQIGAPVGFGSNDTGIVRAFKRVTATDSDGTATTTVRFERAEGNATLWTQSAGANATRNVSTPSYESFESDLGRYGVFGTFAGDDPELSTQNANSGSSAVVLPGGNDGGIVTTEYDTTGAEMVIVQYWAKESDEGDLNDGNGALYVEYLDEGGVWRTADTLQLTGTDPGRQRVVRLGSDAAHGNFSLRFRQQGADAANDEWLIDDPQISVIGEAVGGGTAGGRAPGSGSDDDTGSGDTTAPTFASWTQAQASNSEGGTSNTDYVAFQGNAQDDTGIDRVELRVRDKNGNVVGQSTVNPPFYYEVVALNPEQGMNGNGNYISVELTAYDTAGNTRTCTGTIQNVYDTVSPSSGLNCDQTSTATAPPLQSPGDGSGGASGNAAVLAVTAVLATLVTVEALGRRLPRLLYVRRSSMG